MWEDDKTNYLFKQLIEKALCFLHSAVCYMWEYLDGFWSEVRTELKAYIWFKQVSIRWNSALIY